MENHATSIDNIEQDSTQQVRIFSDSLPIGAFEINDSGMCVYKNPAIDDILGRSMKHIFDFESSEDYDEDWLDWFHPEDRVLLEEKLTSFRKSLQKFSIEYRLNPSISANRWVQLRLHTIGTDEGSRFFGTMEDISERKSGEEALKTALIENEEILSAISAVLIGIDKQGRVKKWNQVAEAAFGISLAGVKGQPLQRCGVKWDWDAVMEAIETSKLQKEPVQIENIRYERADTKEGFLAFTINPIIKNVATNEVSGFLLLGKDITETRLLENQLMQAQKLESIGQLAAGVAHEINTPIQFLGDNSRFLQESFEDLQKVLDGYSKLIDDTPQTNTQNEQCQKVRSIIQEVDLDYLIQEIPKSIEQSLEGIERVASIVRAMKEFSHPGVEGKTPIDINAAIESTITISRNEWKYVAEIEKDFDQKKPIVSCFAGKINQVVLNLIVNAAHAVADVAGKDGNVTGTIRLSTHVNGEWVEIQIADSGAGIPDHICNKIFDPFFTTKEVGKGTGQGLSIAHNVVVNEHGGTISFETELGKGTTFIIRLPLLEKEETQVSE